MRRLLALAIVGVGTGACDSPPQENPGDPVSVVARGFYPRIITEDWMEVVPLADVGDRFLLFVRLAVKSPVEGPWTARFEGPEGGVLDEIPGLKVDPATGNITFLCEAGRFMTGDWRLIFALEPGGRTVGDSTRTYRFRIESGT